MPLIKNDPATLIDGHTTRLGSDTATKRAHVEAEGLPLVEELEQLLARSRAALADG